MGLGLSIYFIEHPATNEAKTPKAKCSKISSVKASEEVFQKYLRPFSDRELRLQVQKVYMFLELFCHFDLRTLSEARDHYPYVI